MILKDVAEQGPREASVVTSWPRPLPAFLLDGDELRAVQLLSAVYHPDSATGFYVGFFTGRTAVLHRWVDSAIALDEGTALNAQATRARAAKAWRPAREQVGEQVDAAIRLVSA